MNKELELDFIPCDIHPLVQAVVMEVKDNGAIQFKCRGCDVASYALGEPGVSVLDDHQQLSIW